MNFNGAKALRELSVAQAGKSARRVRARFRLRRSSAGQRAMVPSDVERLLAIAIHAVRERRLAERLR